MNIAAIYIRLSKEDRDKERGESESIQNQRMILDSYAKQHNWHIYDHYIDEDWSGSDRKRPEFHRMIHDAELGRFDIVLVKTQSRFARDNKYIEDYVHNLFKDMGIRFVSVVDNIDTSQTGSKLSSRVHAIFDEEQLDLLSSNIRKSFEEKAKQGQFFGAMPPYGYKKDPDNKNHLIIDEEAAQAVRMIFEMTAAGYTYMAIAKRLNECGFLIPSQYKKQHGYNVDGMYNRYGNLGLWTRDMVRMFINNEVYIGTVVNHKSTVINFRTKKKKNLPKECHIKADNMHDAIISPELWDKVQGIKQSRSRAKRSGKGVKHPLSGKIFCEACGSKFYKCKSGDIEYFRCYKASATDECNNKKRIRTDVLENIVIDKINSIIKQYIDNNMLDNKIYVDNRLELLLSEYINRKNKIEKKMSEEIVSLKKLLKAFTENVVERSIYEDMQKDYLIQKENNQKHIQMLDKEVEKINNLIKDKKDKSQIIQKYMYITKLSVPIVHEFIDSIIVGETDIQKSERNVIINMSI